MAFSIYISIQIFFADPYLVHLQKYWHHLQQKILMYHLQKNFTVDAMLSVIEKHTTSFKSGISIKSFNFAYFFIKNHNIKTALRERIVKVHIILASKLRVL